MADPQWNVDRAIALAGWLGAQITHALESDLRDGRVLCTAGLVVGSPAEFAHRIEAATSLLAVHPGREVALTSDASGMAVAEASQVLQPALSQRSGCLPEYLYPSGYIYEGESVIDNTLESHTGLLDVATLRHLIDDGAGPRLLDVRTPGEFETAHIPGSYNVPLDTLREHRNELRRHLGEDVVLICRTGNRAAQAEQALAQTGLPNVRVLQGGIVAWEAAGAPVTRGRARWDLERQVRLIAGAIVLVTGLVDFMVPGFHFIGTAIGGGLTFAALTNTCAMGMMLSKLPYNRGPKTDIETVIAELGGR